MEYYFKRNYSDRSYRWEYKPGTARNQQPLWDEMSLAHPGLTAAVRQVHQEECGRWKGKGIQMLWKTIGLDALKSVHL